MNEYNLKQEIKKLGMTQKGFAEHIGVNQNTVTTWVNGSVPMPKWVKLFINYFEKAKTLDNLIDELDKFRK
jgi:transcriptional regulator with XRE-family HTH domain